ncbi:MAG: hypothetical protein QOE83_338 [Actinomycetota bacterium]|jgi:hypothetical protein|nr:hypothetical protein [Actinomycetota bacterium]
MPGDLGGRGGFVGLFPRRAQTWPSTGPKLRPGQVDEAITTWPSVRPLLFSADGRDGSLTTHGVEPPELTTPEQCL